MIKASLLSIALMAGTLMTAEAKLQTFDPLENLPPISSEAVRDVYSGVKFNYLDRLDRVAIVKDFLNTIELEYTLLPLKTKRIGLNFEQLKADAINAEMMADQFVAIDRKNEEEKTRVGGLQAQSNMDFLDRMQLLVSKFQDTHLSINEKIARPFIYNGVRLFRVNGKIIVSAIDKKLISMVEKLSDTDLSDLKIGDEVVSIDGVDVEKKISDLKPYVLGSSDEFGDYYAVRALTMRNFKYEKKNYIKIAFKNGNVFKLPLFANLPVAGTPRVDVLTYLNKYNIPADTSSLGIVYDKTLNKWTDSPTMNLSGYNVTQLKENLRGVTEWNDDDGSPGMRTGYFINKGKTYAVMQLLTFHTTKLKSATAELSFLDAIRAFALDAKENELPVILDLRFNGGGNGSFPAALLSIFTEEGKKYGSPTRGFRLTPYMRLLEEQQNYQIVNGEDQSVGITYDDLRAMMDDIVDNGKIFSPMYTMTGAVKPDFKVKGFNQKMAVLVTASCVSACDMTAFLFKNSKRAQIIGTHSNGTGAGFRSSQGLNTKWEDPLRVFSAEIPNFLFGRPGSDINKPIFGEDSVDELCSENQPTMADVNYSVTATDITKNNLGWLQKAAQVLEAKE